MALIQGDISGGEKHQRDMEILDDIRRVVDAPGPGDAGPQQLLADDVHKGDQHDDDQRGGGYPTEKAKHLADDPIDLQKAAEVVPVQPRPVVVELFIQRSLLPLFFRISCPAGNDGGPPETQNAMRRILKQINISI